MPPSKGRDPAYSGDVWSWRRKDEGWGSGSKEAPHLSCAGQVWLLHGSWERGTRSEEQLSSWSKTSWDQAACLGDCPHLPHLGPRGGSCLLCLYLFFPYRPRLSSGDLTSLCPSGQGPMPGLALPAPTPVWPLLSGITLLWTFVQYLHLSLL